jgi:hypothetical protein
MRRTALLTIRMMERGGQTPSAPGPHCGPSLAPTAPNQATLSPRTSCVEWSEAGSRGLLNREPFCLSQARRNRLRTGLRIFRVILQAVAWRAGRPLCYRTERSLVAPHTPAVTVMPPAMTVPIVMIVPVVVIRAVVPIPIIAVVVAVIAVMIVPVVVITVMLVPGRSRCGHDGGSECTEQHA